MEASAVVVAMLVAACGSPGRTPSSSRLLGAPRFDVDLVRTYRGELSQKQAVSQDGVTTLEEALTISFVDRVEIVPDGNGWLVTEELREVAVSGRVSAEENESTRRMLEGARLEAELGPGRKVLRATGSAPLVDVMFALLQTEPQQLELLPSTPVSPGASWVLPGTIELEGGTLLTSIRTTFEGNAPCGAATCARLTSVNTITPGAGLTGGGGKTTVTLLVSFDDGRPVSREATMELEMVSGSTRSTMRGTSRWRRE